MPNFLTLSLLFILLSLSLSQPTTSFNITKILCNYSDFSTFNSYLTHSLIVPDINSQGTITVLAVDNSNISPLSGEPADVLKKIMEVHIVLDYYGPEKLKGLPNNSSLQATTLFQRSGVATNKQGFVNITVSSSGDITFRSTAPGSSSDAKLVKFVTSQPYNVSVLQISTPIIPNGIDNTTTHSPPPSTPPTPSNQPPKSSPPSKAPSPPSKAPSPPSKAPSPPSKAPSPSDASPPAPETPAPPSREAPTANSPTPSSSSSPSPAADGSTPSPDGDAADTPSSDDKKNSAGAIRACGIWIPILVFFARWYFVWDL
ncbi:hypothetical protein Dimus_027345 [Dionaea muscipula]